MSFRYLTFTAVICMLLPSCKKDKNIAPSTPLPEMKYTVYTGKILNKPNTAFHLDIDQDGVNDINIKAEPTSDGHTYASLQFAVSVSLNASLLVSGNDQTPALTANSDITTRDPQGYTWYSTASIALSEQITPSAGNIYWQGNWPHAEHRYLAIKIARGGKYYLGWIELSINREAGTYELHKAAISTEADATVKAGK